MKSLFILSLLLLLSSFCFVGAQAEEEYIVYFNSTTNCTDGCSITDPTIYEGGILPNSTAEVIFNVTQEYIWLYLPSNETYNVSILTIYGDIGLDIRTNSTLEGNELNVHHVWVHIAAGANLIVHEEASFEDHSKLTTNGTVYATAISFDTGYLYGDDNSTFIVSEEFDFENGTVVFSQTAQFSSHETSFSECYVYFFHRPYLGDVEFEHVDAYFPVGFIVEHQYVISNSNFTAYFPDELQNVNLTLSGPSNLTVSNFIFGSDKIKFNYTGSPFITFKVADNATFNGTLQIPGEIVVDTGSNLVFNGSVNITGGIKVDVNDSTNIQAMGTLDCGQPISLKGNYGLHSLNIDSAVITAPAILLDNFVLTAIKPSQIVGNVVNNGSLHIYEHSNLVIIGNYTQSANTTLGIYNIENSAYRAINLFVNGTAHLDGVIRYNSSETKSKYSATILKAGAISGHFSNDIYDAKADGFTPKLHYELDYVNVTITPNDNKKNNKHAGLYWWVWLLIGCGALVVIVSVVYVVVSRRRSKYQSIART